MQKKKRRAIAIIMTLMVVMSLVPQTAIYGATEKALSTKSWEDIESKIENHRKGWGYDEAGLCTGYVISAINSYYGVDIGGNTFVETLENRLIDRGVTRVVTDRTSGSLTSDMKPGDILIFKFGSSRVHCAILGENGYMYHNSSSRGVQKLKLSEWMSYPDADKGCDRYSVYRGLAQNGEAYLVKTSSNTSISANNNCYSLAGAKYSVKDSSGDQVGTLTTDANGKSNTLELPSGKYTVKETVAPKGYREDKQVYTITVKSGETTKLSVEDDPGSDPAGILLKKYNEETGERYTAPQVKENFGASLEGAEYSITYYDIPDDVVTANGGINSDEFKTYLSNQTAKRSWTFRTNTNGFAYYSDEYKISGGELYKDESGDAALPLGVYVVKETKTPDGFLKDNTSYIRQVKMVGSDVSVWVDKVPESPEPIKRGDISLRKIDSETQKAMANVPFKITSKSSGETHYIMTDVNGEASTSSEWNKHETNNKLDGLTPETGIWFGVTSALNQGKGALPYDTYIIEEVACDANEGKNLYKDEVTIYRDNHVFNIGNIENNEIEIITEAISSDTDSRVTFAKEDTEIVDAVTYHDAAKNKAYQYVGYVVDKVTGETVAEKTIDITPNQSFGDFEIKFNIDTTDYAGHELVVCGKFVADGVICGIHEDVNNAKQTIRVIDPKLETTAVDKATNNHIGLVGEDTVIVDTTSYDDIIKNMTYRLEGVIVDKATGEPIKVDGKEVTAEKKFTADKIKDTEELEFNFDSSEFKGKVLVVYETLYWGDYKIGEHKDINSEAQSIYYPEIKTSAVLKDTGSKYGYAGETTVVVDTISYSGVVPGNTYVAVGQPIDKETEQPAVVSEVPFSVEFVAAESEGTVDLEVAFDATAYAGKDIVMFEELYLADGTEDGVLIAEHKDINDEAQTVHFSKIETKALFDNGKNIIIPSKETNLTDTMSYFNLEKDKQYRAKGYLMDKATNDLFRAIDLNAPNEDTNTGEEDTTEEETFIKVKSNSDTIELLLMMEGWPTEVEKMTAEKVEDGLYKVTKNESLIAPEQEEDFAMYLFAQIFAGYVPDVYVGDELCSMEGEDTLVIPVEIDNKVTLTYKWREGTEKDYNNMNVTDIDVDVNSVKGETTFTAEDVNGNVNVDFKFDSSNIDNGTIVVFEELYLVSTDEQGNEVEILVAEHKDINDADQTVTIKAENGPKTGIAVPFIGVMMLLCLGTGAYVLVNRRRMDV